jgi:hypothetical protein
VIQGLLNGLILIAKAKTRSVNDLATLRPNARVWSPMTIDHARIRRMPLVLMFTLIGALIAVPSTTRAQSSCLIPDSVAIPYFQSQLVIMVTASDTATVNYRNSINLPSTNASAVTLVTDAATCLRAAIAIAAITPGGDPSPAAYVFKIGSTRFVGFNGRQKVHGSQYAYIFDKSFVILASFPF